MQIEPKPINILKYLNQKDIYPTRLVFRDYFRDIIKIYGINAVYVKQDIQYPNIYEEFANYALDEEVPRYVVSGELPIYLDVTTDSFILSKFGLESQQKYTVYFDIRDFEFLFANLLQQRQIKIDIDIPVNISGDIPTLVSAEYISEDNILSGIISGTVCGDYINQNLELIKDLDNNINMFKFTNYDNNVYVNPLLYLPNKYDYENVTFSAFRARIKEVIDDYNLLVNLQGIIVYKVYSDYAEGKYNVAKPTVGDYLILPIFDNNKFLPTSAITQNNYEEFEIINIIPQNIAPNGLNPLLQKYVYACEVMRRYPSFEDGIATNERDAITSATIMTENRILEKFADDLFNYNISAVQNDGILADRIYGRYGGVSSEVITSYNNDRVDLSVDNLEKIDSLSGIIYSFGNNSHLFTDSITLYYVPSNSISGYSIFSTAISGYPEIIVIDNNTISKSRYKYLESDGYNLFFRDLDKKLYQITNSVKYNDYLIEKLELQKLYRLRNKIETDNEYITIDNNTLLYSDGNSLLFINTDFYSEELF